MPASNQNTPRNLGRGVGRGRGRGRGGRGFRNRGPSGTIECVCPKCGHKETHQFGVPCAEVKCPKCQTEMRGDYCK